MTVNSDHSFRRQATRLGSRGYQMFRRFFSFKQPDTFVLQSLRYLAVGGTSVVVYFVLLGLLFSVLRAPYPLAVAIAYILGVAVHFFGNRTFTFGAARTPIAGAISRYAAMTLLNYCIQVAVLFLTYDVGGWNFYLGAATGVIATLITGFLLMRAWVFAHHSRAHQSAQSHTIPERVHLAAEE